MKKVVITLIVGLGIGIGWLSLSEIGTRAESSAQGEAIMAHLRRLTASDYQVRNDAAVALGQIGPEAAPFLVCALERQPGALERVLLRFNRRFGFPDIQPSTVPQLRVRAAEQLAAVAAKRSETPSALVRALADEDRSVVEEAQRSLRRIGPDLAVPALVKALSARDAQTRGAAAEVLRDFGSHGRAATQRLTELLRDRHASVRVKAARAVASVAGAAAVTELSRALEDKDSSMRSAAADALGAIGGDAGSAAGELSRSLTDRDAGVRVASARALWSIRREASEAVPVLVDALDQPNAWEAALVLGAMGPAASNAVPALIEALKREKVPRPLRETPVSALALGRIGAASVPSLIKVLGSDEARVRTSAALALGFAGASASRATPDLVVLLSDSDLDVRRAATLSLGAIDPGRKELVPALLTMANDDDIFLSSLAASTLERIDPAAAGSLRRE